MEKILFLAKVTIYKVKDRLSPQFKFIYEWVQDLVNQILLNDATVFIFGLGPLFSKGWRELSTISFLLKMHDALLKTIQHLLIQ
jgi:hypothetical protein